MSNDRKTTNHSLPGAIVTIAVAWLLASGIACGGEWSAPTEDGGDGGDGDADGDIDGDADRDVSPDADADADTDTGSDADIDPDPDADIDPDPDADADIDPDPDVETDADELPPAPDPNLEGPLGLTETSDRVGTGGGWPVERRINVDLYLPSDLSGAPYPVVIYSHGFQLSGSDYASTGRRLASHGLVAVLPSYGDNLIAPRSHSALADDVMAIIDWVAEQAATDGSELYGVADPARIGAGGHSRGGKHSILAAIRDPRILASFNVDPVDSGHPLFGETEAYPSVTPELMADFTIPSGFVGAGRSAEAPMGQACAPEAQNYHQYFVEAPSPAFEYSLPEAGHLDFPDGCGLICRTCTSGDEPEWNAITTMVAFYRVYLASDTRYRPWIDGAEVTALADRVVFASR